MLGNSYKKLSYFYKFPILKLYFSERIYINICMQTDFFVCVKIMTASFGSFVCMGKGGSVLFGVRALWQVVSLLPESRVSGRS